MRIMDHEGATRRAMDRDLGLLCSWGPACCENENRALTKYRLATPDSIEKAPEKNRNEQ